MQREHWLETTRFRDVEQTEEAVNPMRYGETLARWLAGELRKRDWTVADTFAEDWGWLIELRCDGFAILVACGNEDGTVMRWGVSFEAHVGFFKRLFGSVDPEPTLARLDADVAAILAEDSHTSWSGREQPSGPPPPKDGP